MLETQERWFRRAVAAGNVLPEERETYRPRGLLLLLQGIEDHFFPSPLAGGGSSHGYLSAC